MKANLWVVGMVSVFVGVSGFFCGGCGKSDAQQAGDTARTFMSGMANHDRTMVETTLTKLAREKMQEGETSGPDKNDMGQDGYTVGTPTIDGESASVPVTVTKKASDSETDKEAPSATVTEVGKSDTDGDKPDAAQTRTEILTLKLRRENGEWKVWAMRVPFMPGGPALTMDFEHPEAVIGEAFKGMGEGLGAAMKGMGEGLGAMFKGMAEGAKAANTATQSHPK